MLGRTYFELAQAICRVTSFDDVVDLLVAKLPALIGADEVIVLGCSIPSGIYSVFGHGALAGRLRSRLDVVQKLIGDHPITRRVDLSEPGDLGFAMSDYVSPDEYRNSRFAKEVFGESAMADVLFGLLVSGKNRMAFLNCYFSSPGMSVQKRERFDAILLTVRGVLERLEADNVERVVRQRVFSASAPLAVFFANSSAEVWPINHAAVQFAESAWSDDEAMKSLEEEPWEKILVDLDDAWVNPVTADWKDIQIDIGSGPLVIHALPKLSGEVILMFPVSGQEPVGDEALTILTRRQREIMDWISEGKTSAEAAIILGISPRTVEKHLEAIFQRLGVENRIGAMRRYLDLKRGI